MTSSVRATCGPLGRCDSYSPLNPFHFDIHQESAGCENWRAEDWRDAVRRIAAPDLAFFQGSNADSDA